MQPLVGFCVTSASRTERTEENDKCLVTLLHCSRECRAMINSFTASSVYTNGRYEALEMSTACVELR